MSNHADRGRLERRSHQTLSPDSALGEDLARAYEAWVAADLELTSAAIRAVVWELGGEGRVQVAAGNKHLAGQLGVSVRTVQRWQKEGGDNGA